MIQLTIDFEKVESIIDLLIELTEARDLGRAYSTGTGYEHYVQTVEDQAWMHKGVWPTDEDMAVLYEPEMRDALVEGFQDTIDSGSNSIARYVDDILLRIVEYAATYPPEPSGSLYERTFDLAESWTHELSL